jgi:hypothetical protein
MGHTNPFLGRKDSSLEAISPKSKTPSDISYDVPYENIYSKRIVGFIDILGFRNVVLKSGEFVPRNGSTSPEAQEKDLAHRIYNALNIAYDDFEKKFIKDNELTDIEESTLDMKLTTFSDSVIISTPDDPLNFALLIHMVSHMVRDMLRNGFLTRGGVAYGEVFHRENRDVPGRTLEPVFGPAFIKAYDLESKQANSARIILCNEMWKKVQEWCLNGCCKHCKYIDNRIDRDTDGPAVINTLQHLKELAFEDVKPELEEIRERLETVLGYYTESPRVFSKISKFSKNFNTLLEECYNKDAAEVKISADYLP